MGLENMSGHLGYFMKDSTKMEKGMEKGKWLNMMKNMMGSGFKDKNMELANLNQKNSIFLEDGKKGNLLI